jgi:hypothetical protein
VLQEQTDAWRHGGGYGLVSEFDAQADEHVVRLKADPTPVVLSLVIGDALYAMRSALDQLAFQLAETHTGPLSTADAKKVEFPIFGDRPMTPSERARRMGMIDPQAATIIDGESSGLPGVRVYA